MKPTIKLLAASFWLAGIVSGLCADLRTGLVTYWPLDADNAGTTPDMAAYYGNNLTDFNAPTVGSGQVGNAFTFNGTSQYASITHLYDSSAGLPIYNSAGGYTVAMWVKGAAQATKYVFAEGCTTNTSPLLLLATGGTGNGRLVITVRTTGGGAGGTPLSGVASTSVVFDNAWHHIAWVDDHGNAKLYIDGNLDATNFKYTWPGASSFSLNTTTIGALVRSTVAGWFSGQIDDVALWERPLSAAEVTQVKTSGITIPAAATILAQPTGSTNAPGRRVALSVSAVGTPPMTFQWLKDGAPVDGGTSRILVVTNLTATASNNFSVLLNNTAGPVTSALAPVVTLTDPTPNLANGIVSYWPLDTLVETAAGNSTPDLYYNHTDLGLTNMSISGGSVVPGQVSNALTFASTLSQYGKRLGGTPIYSTTNYTVSFWVQGNPGQFNKQVFAEGGTNSAGNNGDYFLLGTENSPIGGGSLNIKSSGSPWLNDLKSKQVVFDGGWHHVAWVDENGAARLYVDGVVDATDFTYYRSNLVLNATAVGALYRASATYFLYGSVDEVAIWNRALTWTEIQQVKTSGVPLPIPRIPPTITAQPQGSTNRLGDRVTFSVTATGSLPLSYQWRKDATVLSGETGSTLTLFLTASATNDYTVVITNIANALTSSPARLAVLADPTPNLGANLLNYWPLDTVTDVPSPTSPDLASHNDLLLGGLDSSSPLPGRFANALPFSGAQYGERVGGFPASVATNYTVSLWVNGYAQPATEVFAEGSIASAAPLFLIGPDYNGTSSSADILIRTDASVTSINHRKTTRPVFDGTWHHLVWVDENGQGKVFVDGVLDETSFAYTRGTSTLNTTAIGALMRGTAAYYYAGLIDDVGVWDRRLSWTEIQQISGAAIPAPVGPTAPAVAVQPADLTNFFFATSSFSALASGTAPLSYQWRKDGVDIPAASNPSATNNVLNLGGLLPPSAAGGYSLVIANAGGAVTSRVAQLVLIMDPLKLEFSTNGAANIQPGFAAMTLAAPSVNLGGVTISVSAVGGITLAARDRNGTGTEATNNPTSLTQAKLYNDFIFGNNTTTMGAGVNVLIEHLAPNTKYGLTIWSFDAQSFGARVSDWTEIASGTTVPFATGYSFDGSVLPTTDYECTLGGVLTSSSAGSLQIQGLKSGNGNDVFLNALRLEATPTPTSRILGAGFVGGNYVLKAVGQYPSQPISFEQTSDLGAGAWVPAVGAISASTNGMVVTAGFPVSATPVFYRAVSPLP